VEVGVGVLGHIIVEDNVNALEIDTATEDVGGDENTRLVLLEVVVALDTLGLVEGAVHGDGGERALVEELVELVATGNGGHEDDDLVELEAIEEIGQLAVLLLLLEVDVVLEQAVESELALVVDVDFDGIDGELLGNGADLLGEGGGEHHDLLGVRGLGEDVLHGATHIEGGEQRIAFIEDEALEVREIEVALVDELLDTTGSADDDVGHLGLEEVLVLLYGDTAEEDLDLDLRHVFGETEVLLADLVCELAGVAEDEGVDGVVVLLDVELLESGEDEDGGLTGTGLGLADDVVGVDGLGQAFLLDCWWQIEAKGRYELDTNRARSREALT